MKIIDDPVKWAEQGVGTNLRLFFMLAFQVFLAVFVAVKRDYYCLIIGVVFMPFLYLIALRGMLKELKKKGENG